MQYVTDSKLILLSSAYATSKNGTYNSNLSFSLNNILTQDKNILYTQVNVVYAQIPISYYLINSNNNLLSTSTGNYTLINGNYDAGNFITMLLSILPSGFSLTVSSITNKFTLNYTSDFTIFSTSTCQIIMGMSNNTNYTSSSSSLTFPNVCNFLSTKLIKIKSDTIQTKNLDSYNMGCNNVLCAIPVSDALTGIIRYKNDVSFKNIIQNLNIDSINIQIADENDTLLNFNGIDINITLQIDNFKKVMENDSHLHPLLTNEIKDPYILQQLEE